MVEGKKTMSVHTILAVAAGGALGAVGRFLITSGGEYFLGYGFPFGTVIVNVLGSFALGILIEVSTFAWSPSAELRAFLVAGVLGAFTTFSTFSLDAVSLWTRGDFLLAGMYMAGSVLFGITGLLAGMFLTKAVLI